MSPFLKPGAESRVGNGAPTNYPALAGLLKFDPHLSIYPEANVRKQHAIP